MAVVVMRITKNWKSDSIRITKTENRILFGLRKLWNGFHSDYEKTVRDSAWIPISNWFWIPKKKINLWGITTFFGWGFQGKPGDSSEKKTNFGHICSPGFMGMFIQHFHKQWIFSWGKLFKFGTGKLSPLQMRKISPKLP
mgnify:CR=1 FL=1